MLSKARSPKSQVSQRSSRSAKVEGKPPQPSVLIVDDDPAIREMVAAYLELEGYLPLAAGDAHEAVRQALANSPQAIVLDVMMPGIDGFALCKSLRENPVTNRSVILLLSALEGVDSRVRGFNAGADDFVSKPFEPSELLARLQAHLRRLQTQQDKEKMLEKLAEKLADMNRRLAEEASTDSLTGLHNRRHFWKRFEEEVKRARRFSRPLSLVLIDLDHFKEINDQHGHAVGDKVLARVGKLLLSHLREIDVAGRYGGEEFAVLLPETARESALRAAERLLEAANGIEIPPLPAGRLTFSAGVATFPVDSSFPQELFEKADAALYQAKGQGRNRVMAATPEAPSTDA